MQRGKTRILTTHTGSLPRPERLAEMLGSVARGELAAFENRVSVIIPLS